MKNRYINEVDHGLVIAAIIMVLLGLILFSCGCGIHDDCPARGNWVPSRMRAARVRDSTSLSPHTIMNGIFSSCAWRIL